MRGLFWPSVLLALSACSDDDDLGHYVAEVKARPATPPAPLPIVDKYEPQAYRPGSERSPFVSPQPESVQVPAPAASACTQPEPDGSELERHSLDNLSFRGTLGDGQQLWALLHTRDGITHRIGVGQKLGLNHGEIIGITDHDIILKEQVSDGAGCWISREARLMLDRAEQ
ncbi:pilus assembly protein PilP [Zobellella sp. An-6]|uniref:pilus assembly protein PilP n=1 Tax=Zobellella sp. An-6 TaxID=3400218 RepID=UPI00404214FE